MREHWSDDENDVVVDAYFQMLHFDLSRSPYVKKTINEEVRAKTRRSRGSIEFKFQNVSAVLREMDFPIIRGYKPAVNFQASLRDAVLKAMGSSGGLMRVAFDAISKPVRSDIGSDFRWNIIEAPVMQFSRDHAQLRAARRVDFAQLEHQNRRLGLAGERLVVHREKQQLIKLGREDLATKVEHVSETRGDGLGYDVLSFRGDARERFIEVKTTRLGPYWPAIVTRNEVEFSGEFGDRFEVHRVFDFDDAQGRAGLYVVEGPIGELWTLDPTVFKALPRRRVGV